MKKIILYYSLILFFFCLVATILSITGIDVKRAIPHIQLNSGGILISIFACFLLFRKGYRPELTKFHKTVIGALILFSVYCHAVAFFNITPIQRNGKYYLVNRNHEEVIDEAEYKKTRRENFLSDSSGWMLFYGACALILLTAKKPEETNL